MKKPKYIIKFVSKKVYAEELVNGELYMRPARYYHNIEQGRGDIAEAAVFPGICSYYQMDYPIYCFYSVFPDDIQNNQILIPNKCINDFECLNGYCVLIDFDEFEKYIFSEDKAINTDKQVEIGVVRYGNPDKGLIERVMKNETIEHLFLKRPFFRYQREFRIAIWEYVSKDIDYKEYFFKTNLKSISELLNISDLEHDNEYYCINLEVIEEK